VNIGCFGAIRPLKNQLIQAFAAIRFANDEGKKLRFHINGSRVEGKAEPNIKNIRELFKSQTTHELVEHTWMDHDQFVEVIKEMDMTMQVSFSETYNIVAADAIAALVPVITSDEITFVPSAYHAKCTDTDDIVAKLKTVYNGDNYQITLANYNGLVDDAAAALSTWLTWINSEV
jgi:glycosyltransferase involved in cell wall biosynthesis